jgi:hypothetical protein
MSGAVPQDESQTVLEFSCYAVFGNKICCLARVLRSPSRGHDVKGSLGCIYGKRSMRGFCSFLARL